MPVSQNDHGSLPFARSLASSWALLDLPAWPFLSLTTQLINCTTRRHLRPRVPVVDTLTHQLSPAQRSPPDHRTSPARCTLHTHTHTKHTSNNQTLHPLTQHSHTHFDFTPRPPGTASSASPAPPPLRRSPSQSPHPHSSWPPPSSPHSRGASSRPPSTAPSSSSPPPRSYSA